MGVSPVFTWLTHTLEDNFTPVRLLKESSRGSIDLICHRKTRQEFILRRFRGNPEVYRKLLGCSCRHLPATLEVAVDNQCSVENVTRFARNAGYQVEVQDFEGDYKLVLTK